MSGRLDGLSTLPAVPGTPGSPVGQGRLGSSDPWESNTPIPEAAAQNAARTLVRGESGESESAWSPARCKL